MAAGGLGTDREDQEGDELTEYFVEGDTMDSYAIVLYFDPEASSNLQNAINQLAVLTSNTYLIDVKIPPHITVGCFLGESPEPMVETVETFLKRVEPFEVRFSGVGTFAPKVVFAAPVKDDCLKHINGLVNEKFLKIFQAADQENYIPTKWVPHCALAVRLDEAQFREASVAEIELPAAARMQKIALARCNPYQEIKVWEV